MKLAGLNLRGINISNVLDIWASYLPSHSGAEKCTCVECVLLSRGQCVGILHHYTCSGFAFICGSANLYAVLLEALSLSGHLAFGMLTENPHLHEGLGSR